MERFSMEAGEQPAYSQVQATEGEAKEPVARSLAMVATKGEARRPAARRLAVAGACSLAGLAFAATVALAARRAGAHAGGSRLADHSRGVIDVHSLAEKEEKAAETFPMFAANCSSQFAAPPKPGFATEHNGIKLSDVCIRDYGPHHVFIIGDWGGLKEKGYLHPVRHLSHRLHQGFQFVYPADESAQFRVRDVMVGRAKWADPDYVLNVGDNFYWGGVYDYCGSGDFARPYSNGGSIEHKMDPVNQFKEIFEDIYNGPGLDGKMWLGVLGNHDWGGWRFDQAWDQAIGYTWNYEWYSKKRWLTPALYYYVTVKYPDFVVDYYFLDTNVWDALPYGENPPHNICGPHNPWSANCGLPRGPTGPADNCVGWFKNLWEVQKRWLDGIVPRSKAHWRIVVTHFPPYWGKWEWMYLAPRHEFDAIITGHRHSQSMHGPTDPVGKIWPEDVTRPETNEFLNPTAWIVSGGGGGITSEHMPNNGGWDDQYGFVHMELKKEKLMFTLVSHGGQERRKLEHGHYYSHGGLNEVIGHKKDE